MALKIEATARLKDDDETVASSFLSPPLNFRLGSLYTSLLSNKLGHWIYELINTATSFIDQWSMINELAHFDINVVSWLLNSTCWPCPEHTSDGLLQTYKVKII